jgi:hypothetical protein
MKIMPPLLIDSDYYDEQERIEKAKKKRIAEIAEEAMFNSLVKSIKFKDLIYGMIGSYLADLTIKTGLFDDRISRLARSSVHDMEHTVYIESEELDVNKKPVPMCRFCGCKAKYDKDGAVELSSYCHGCGRYIDNSPLNVKIGR